MGHHDAAIAELEAIAQEGEREQEAADAAERKARAKEADEPAATLPGAVDLRATAAAEKALMIVEMALRLWCPTIAFPAELYGEAGEQVGPFIQDRGWHERGLLKVGPYDNAIKAGMFVGAVVAEAVRQVNASKERPGPVTGPGEEVAGGIGGNHREFTTS